VREREVRDNRVPKMGFGKGFLDQNLGKGLAKAVVNWALTFAVLCAMFNDGKIESWQRNLRQLSVKGWARAWQGGVPQMPLPTIASWHRTLVEVSNSTVFVSFFLCFVLLNRYLGIITFPEFLHERAKDYAPTIEHRRHTSSPCPVWENVWWQDPHPPP